MTEYTFNTESINDIMKELIIYLMNQRTGYNPDTGENPAKAEDFFAAQADVAKLRQKALDVYGSQNFKSGQFFQVHEIGMAVYREVVEKKTRLEAVLKMSRGSLLKRC